MKETRNTSSMESEIKTENILNPESDSGASSGSKVMKAGAGYIIGNYMLKGITFFTVPIFSRMLSTTDYGEFNTYISYESILFILVGLAIHSSVNNAKYEYKEKFDEYISSCIMLVLFSTGIWLVFANVFFNQLKSLLEISRTVANILVLHCFGSSVLQVYNTYVGLSYSYKSFLKMTYVNALSNMLLSIVLIMTLFTNQRSLGRIVGTAVPIIAIGIFIVIYFVKKAKPRIKKEYWKFCLTYSLPIIPHGISQIILSSFDLIMIKRMIGASEAGIYSFSYSIYLILKVTTNSLENVWKPWFYEKMASQKYDSIRKQGTRYALAIAFLTTLVLLVSPELVKILGDRDYWSATSCVVPVLIGGYYSFLFTLPSLVEYYYGKTKYIALGTISAAIFNIILNYIFIPRFGYVAAAYTTLVTYLFYFSFHYIIAIRLHGYSLFSFGMLFGINGSLLVIGAIVLALENYIIIRWILAFLFGIYCVYWADKQFFLIEKIKKRLSKVV